MIDSVARARPRVHVVGGQGFVGAAVVRALRAAGAAVSLSGRAGAPARHLADAEVLLWCAGGRGEDPEALLRSHAAAPVELLDATPAARAVVYVSSGEVYGSQEVPFDERAPCLGVTPYARAKRQGEELLRAACQRRGLTLAIARPAVIYGPGQRPGMLVPSAIAHLSRGQELAVTEGAQTRDFVYVEDVAAALTQLALAPRDDVFNLGTGQELRVRTLLELLADAIAPEARALLRWGQLPYRAQEQMRYALCSQRAARALGWRPMTELAQGLARCVRHHRAAARPAELRP